MKTITSDEIDKWIHFGDKILNDVKIQRADKPKSIVSMK